MLECLIIGDSIATGIDAALRAREANRCAVVAKVGTSSDWAARNVPGSSFATVAIATSSNDAKVPGLKDRLVRLRAALSAARVLWIAPYNRTAARQVVAVARLYGDKWMDMAELRSRDGVHPRSYGALATAVVRYGYAGR
jgi:hypothetical protein